MPNNRRIAKNTVFLYFRMLLVMGVTLYTSRIVLDVLGAEDFGLYNVVGGIVVMFTFLNGSLGAATSRYITFELGKKNHKRLNEVFNVAFIAHIVIALIIILLAETVGLWFFYEKMTIPESRLNAAFWVYQISIATSFISLTQVPYNATIIAHEKMGIFAAVGIFEALAKLAVAYLLYISPIDHLVFYALLLCLIQISIQAYYRFYCNRKFQECKLSLCKDLPLYKEMIGYAGSDMIGQISVLAQGQGLNILLNIFFGPVVNAARGIAYQVQGAITQFSGNFMTAVRPQIIKSYAEGDINGMMRLVCQSSRFSFFLMWIISFPICLERNYILNLWLGKYPDHSASFLILVIILCLIQTIKTPRTTVFHATGQLKLVNIIVGSILCAAFPLAYLMLKAGLPPESAFYAAIISMILSEAASIVILKKYIDYSILDYIKTVYARCIVTVAASLAIPCILYQHTVNEGFLRLIITCILTTTTSLICIYWFGINKSERKDINKIISQRLSSKLTKWKN